MFGTGSSLADLLKSQGNDTFAELVMTLSKRQSSKPVADAGTWWGWWTGDDGAGGMMMEGDDDGGDVETMREGESVVYVICPYACINQPVSPPQQRLLEMCCRPALQGMCQPCRRGSPTSSRCLRGKSWGMVSTERGRMHPGVAANAHGMRCVGSVGRGVCCK